MLDNKVTRAGTLLFKGGRIYIDGWELAEAGMCREHVIFACLYVAQELHKAALANIAQGGGAKNTCADMPRETPREWLCSSTQAFDAMFDGSAPETRPEEGDDATGESVVPKGHFWRGLPEWNRHQCRNCGQHYTEHYHTDEASRCPR